MKQTELSSRSAKIHLRSLLIGMLAMALLLSGVPALAAVMTKTIDVTYRDIKLYVDGVLVTPKDTNGNIVEPFIHDGTTYLPVRALSEALGKQIRWDGTTSSVIVGLMPGDILYFDDVLQPYQVEGENFTLADISTGKYISIAGVKYYHGVTNTWWAHNARDSGFYNLGGKYSQLSGMYGPRDSESTDDMKISFYADGRLIKTLEFRKGDMPRDFSVDVTSVIQLKIELYGAGASIVNWQIK